MGDRALILEAHHTTHIEGTRLTLDHAERLWKGEEVPEADPENERQGKAVGFLLQHDKLSIQDFGLLCPGINRRSLQRDLKKLLKKGLFTVEGATNQLVYLLKI